MQGRVEIAPPPMAAPPRARMTAGDISPGGTGLSGTRNCGLPPVPLMPGAAVGGDGVEAVGEATVASGAGGVGAVAAWVGVLVWGISDGSVSRVRGRSSEALRTAST